MNSSDPTANECNSFPPHDPNYVIVNLSHGYYVLPGEEPRALATLDSVAEEIASLIDEHGHVLGQTLQVFRLCPIPEKQAQLKARVEIKLSELEAQADELEAVIASLQEE